MTHIESYENEVLREQLDYLIAHVGEHAQGCCLECRRYLRVRSTLLEIFGEAEAVEADEPRVMANAA